MRVIPKNEIYVEAKSSLAGTCAVRMYLDGNITFSKQASELMSFNNFKYFSILEDEKGNILLLPNEIEGYKLNQRINKYTFCCNSKPIVNYISNRFNKKPERNKPLEFIIKRNRSMHEGYNCFKILFQTKLKTDAL